MKKLLFAIILFCCSVVSATTICPNWTPVRQCRSVGIKISNGRLPIYGISEWYGSVFTWMPKDNLNARSGGALTCIRATNTTSLRADGSYDFVPWNAIGADHYVGGAYTDVIKDRTKPADWLNHGMNAPSDTGVQSILPGGKNLIRWTADGTNTYHTTAADVVPSMSSVAGDVYNGKLILKDVNQRYLMLVIYGLVDAENYELLIDLTNKTATSASTSAHPNTFTATVTTNTDNSLTIAYKWTCPTTDVNMGKPIIYFSNAAWAGIGTFSGSADFACLTCVKSPFQVPIIYPVPETNAAYAGAATILSASSFNIGTEYAIFSVMQSNHNNNAIAELSGADDALGGAHYFGFTAGFANYEFWCTLVYAGFNTAIDTAVPAAVTNSVGAGDKYVQMAKFGKTSFGYVETANGSKLTTALYSSRNFTPVPATPIIKITLGYFSYLNSYHINQPLKSMLLIQRNNLTMLECQQIANALLRITP